MQPGDDGTDLSLRVPWRQRHPVHVEGPPAEGRHTSDSAKAPGSAQAECSGEGARDADERDRDQQPGGDATDGTEK